MIQRRYVAQLRRIAKADARQNRRCGVGDAAAAATRKHRTQLTTRGRVCRLGAARDREESEVGANPWDGRAWGASGRKDLDYDPSLVCRRTGHASQVFVAVERTDLVVSGLKMSCFCLRCATHGAL